MKLLVGLLLLLIQGLFLSFPAYAQQVRNIRPGVAGSWRIIGTTVANFNTDRDVIVVQGADNFRKLKFKVYDAPLNMMKMLVVYDNGEPDNIEIRYNIPQGGESRIIDLRGVGKRSIRKVEYWYDTKGFARGRAKVELWGMK